MSKWATSRVAMAIIALFSAVSFSSAATAAAATPVETALVTASPPGLSITLADGTAQTHSGATLSYTASVSNAGANQVKGLLEITIPSYSTYVGTDSASQRGSNISWPLTIGGGKQVSERATVKVGTIPKTEVRFTTIATLYSGGSGTDILVRTADPDTIRGVVDPAHTVGKSTTPEGQPAPVLVVFAIIAGIAILVVAVIGCTLWARRRRAPHAPAFQRDSTQDGGAGLVVAATGRPGVKGEGDERPSA